MDRRVLWEIRTSRPLTVAALAFLTAYAVPILWPTSPSWALTACAVTEWVVWAIFITDLVIRVVLAQDRRAFLRSAWLDIALLAVPMLRPLRALRAVVALSILGRRGGEHGRGRVVGSVGAAVLLVSDDLDEIMRLSSRILVMFRGEVTGDFAAGEADAETLSLRMAGNRTGAGYVAA